LGVRGVVEVFGFHGPGLCQVVRLVDRRDQVIGVRFRLDGVRRGERRSGGELQAEPVVVGTERRLDRLERRFVRTELVAEQPALTL
jgi:hypothetical protein